MQPNHVKRTLQAGGFCCGTWMNFASNNVAELIGLKGFDWLLIDMEHGPGDYTNLITQLQGIQAAGSSVPIVRVEWNDAAVIKRVLDAGAYGVMVPGIRTVQEARAAARAVRYPPKGIRGLASSRCAGYGSDADYVRQANDEVMLFLQIETYSAIEQIDAILDVEGIDVAFLGPNDLSGDMGHVGNWDHPEVQRAVERLEEAAHSRKIPLGTVSRDWEAAERYLSRGYRAMSLMGDTSILAAGCQHILSQYRAHPCVRGA